VTPFCHLPMDDIRIAIEFGHKYARIRTVNFENEIFFAYGSLGNRHALPSPLLAFCNVSRQHCAIDVGPCTQGIINYHGGNYVALTLPRNWRLTWIDRA
jgi:hypothetical protein